MTIPIIHRTLFLALIVLLLPACTTMQTTYFRGSYQQFATADDGSLLPHKGEPGFSLVDDMEAKARAMHDEGYVMLGYSQFVSPLLTTLAESYATKWGAEVGAAHVVLEKPRAGDSNLHYFLVTYWGRYDPAAFALGVNWVDLPEELLQRIGEDKNLVIVRQVVPGTPAAPGLRADDFIVAIDGDLALNTRELSKRIAANSGKEIVLSITRKGEELDIPLRLATPRVRSGAPRTATYRETPWLSTQPRDWSGLSVGNLAAANTAATQQRIARDQELYAERIRAEAQANLNRLATQPTDSMPTSRRAGGTTDVPTNRRGGSVPQLPPGPSGVPSNASFAEMWKKMGGYGKDWSVNYQNRMEMGLWAAYGGVTYANMFKWRSPVFK